MSEIDNVNPESTESPIVENLNPKSITEEINAEVESEVETEAKIMEGVEDEFQEALAEEEKELTEEEKREFFIQTLKESKIKFHPIKHGVKITTTVVTDELLGRKHVVKSRELQTNVTTNQFGSAYRKERKRKNKQAKASRKANR